MNKSTRELIAIRCMLMFQDMAERLEQGITGTLKECKSQLMDAWRHVRGTNAWIHGDDVWEHFTGDEDVDINAWWCAYTVYALDICRIVRAESARLNIPMPDAHVNPYNNRSK